MQASEPKRPEGASRLKSRDTTIPPQRAPSLGFAAWRALALCAALLALIGAPASAQRAPGAARPPAQARAAEPAPQQLLEVGAAAAPLRLHADTEGRADRLLLSLAGRPGVGFAALWSDLRHGTPAVYLRRFSRDGDARAAERAVRERYSPVIEIESSVALGPEGHGAVVWQLQHDPAGPRTLRIRELDPEGPFPDTEQFIGSKKGWVRSERKGPEPPLASSVFWPRAVVDGPGRVHVIWNYDGHLLLQELEGELRWLDPEGPPAEGAALLLGQHAGPALAVWSTAEGIRALALQGPDPAPAPCGSGRLLGAAEDLRGGRGYWLLLEQAQRVVLRPLDASGRVSGEDVRVFPAPVGHVDLASWSEGLAIVRQQLAGDPSRGAPGGPFQLLLFSADGTERLRPPMIVAPPESRTAFAPRVAAAGDRLLVAWSERRAGGLEVFGRLLRAGAFDLEPEFPLAAARATSSQSRPVAASVTDRRAVAVWVDERSGHASLFGRMITAAGDVMGVEFPVPMGPDREPLETTPCTSPALAMGPGGDFVAAWLEGPRLSCQAFTADVLPREAPGVIVSDLDAARGFAVIRQERYRSWLFAWVAPAGVMVQRVRGDGAPLAAPTAVSGPGPVAHPALLELADGRVLVAWDRTEAGGARLRARLLQAELQASSEVLDLPAPPRGSHAGPLLARAARGGFLVAWTAELSKTGTVVVAREFDARAQPLGAPRALSSPAGREEHLTLARLADGSWVLGWQVGGFQNSRIAVRRLRPGAEEPGPLRALDPSTDGYRVGGGDPVLVGVDRGFLGLWVDAHRGAGLDVWCRAVGEDFDRAR